MAKHRFCRILVTAPPGVEWERLIKHGGNFEKSPFPGGYYLYLPRHEYLNAMNNRGFWGNRIPGVSSIQYIFDFEYWALKDYLDYEQTPTPQESTGKKEHQAA